MATKPFNTPNNFASEGSGTLNNIPLLDSNFTAVQSFNNDGSFFTMLGSDIGTANAYVVTMPTGYIPTAYNKGTLLYFLPANTNTGPSTININSVGLATVIRGDGSALSGGEFQQGRLASIVYDGTNFRTASGSSGALYFYDYDDFIGSPALKSFTGGSPSGKLLEILNPSSTSLFQKTNNFYPGHLGVLQVGCGTTNGLVAGWFTNTVFLDTFTYTIRTVVQTDSVITANPLWFGISANTGTNPATTQNYIGFIGSTGNANWTVNTANGTGTTTVTSVAYNASTWYDLMLVANSSTATFYINGASVGTISATYPASNVIMNISVGIGCSTASNSLITVDLFEMLVTGIPQLGTNPRFMRGYL